MGALRRFRSHMHSLRPPLVGYWTGWASKSQSAWAVVLWSATSVLGGLSRGFGQLLGARAMLGAFESAGVPAAGKLNAAYLEPKNRAIGAAMTQVGLSIAGLVAALAGCGNARLASAAISYAPRSDSCGCLCSC